MTPSELIEEIYQKAKNDVDSLNAFEMNVYVIANADFEVNLGGANGYLYNTAGDELEHLVSSFKEIGCTKLSELTKNIVSLLSKYCQVQDRNERQKVLNSPSAELEDAFEKFEDGIQDQIEDYGDLLEQYILKNKA